MTPRSAWLLAPSALLWIAGVAAPLLFVLRLSLYAPGAAGGEQRFDTLFYQPGTWSTANFIRIASEPFFQRLFGVTAALALVVTAITLLLGYLLAYAIYRASPREKLVLVLLIALPKFTNLVVFVFGVKILLGSSGWIAMAAGEVLLLLPYAALTIAAALHAVPYSLVETARGLGASAFTAFWRVTLPLSLPGVAAAAALVLSWSFSAFLGPYLLGGPAQYTVAVEIDRQVHSDLNWSLAAALSVTLIGVLAVAAFLARRIRRRFA